MVYKPDSVDGDVLRWSVTGSGVTCEVDESYTPTIYVSVHGDGDFSTARAVLRDRPAVVRVATVDERVSFRHDSVQVLQVDVVDLKAVNSAGDHESGFEAAGGLHAIDAECSQTLIDSFTRKHIRHGNNCARMGYRHRRWFR